MFEDFDVGVIVEQIITDEYEGTEPLSLPEQ